MRPPGEVKRSPGMGRDRGSPSGLPDRLLLGVPQMMRLLTRVVIPACLVMATNLYAQPGPDAGATTTGRQVQPEKRVQPAGQDTRQPAKPAATFTPSERIGADSAISFPVDI